MDDIPVQSSQAEHVDKCVDGVEYPYPFVRCEWNNTKLYYSNIQTVG